MTAVDSPIATPLSEGLRPSPSLNNRLSLSNGGGMLAPTRDTDAISMTSITDLEARCGGCRKLIDQENGGIVVAFGTSLWHVDCFRCAKCQEKVSADTNLLLLSDGSPVCGNCSYQCFVCKQAITEEAIMTGDESYHAHCFTCRTCKRRIEELVFAKTTQGIYCMSCHNERVARSRRHAEAKRQRAARKEREAREREEAEGKKREDGGSRSGIPSSGTSTSLNVLANAVKGGVDGSPLPSPNSVKGPDRKSSLPPLSPRDSPDLRPRELSVDRSMGAASPSQRVSSPALSRRDERSLPSSPRLGPTGSSLDVSTRSAPSGSPSPPMAIVHSPSSPMGLSTHISMQASPSTPNLVSPIASPAGPRSPTPRASTDTSPTLGVPNAKSERRRSINPGLVFNMDTQNATFAVDQRAPSPRSDMVQESSSLAAPTPPNGTDPKRRSLSVHPSSTPTTPQIRSLPSTPPGDEKSALGLETQEDKSESVDQRSAATPAEPSPEKVAAPPTDTIDQAPMPRIDAPNLPTMSFSLSDPDFAVLLKEMETTDPSKAAVVVPAPESDKEELLNGGDELSANHLSAGPSTLRKRGSVESFMSINLGNDSAFNALKELVADATGDKVTADKELLNDLIREYQALRDNALTLKTKYTGAKVCTKRARQSGDTKTTKPDTVSQRSSQQYSEGLTIAGEEYDKEAAMRRDLESEVIRLRAQVHGQTARLSLISSDERRAENLRRRSQDLASSLTGLEHDISRLRAQRDISFAEVEELAAKNVGGDVEETTAKLGRSLTRRLETIKEQYKGELGPLSAQREALQREITELRETKEQFLEESTALAAKNEELAELNAQLSRQTEVMQDALARRSPAFNQNLKTPGRGHPSGSPSMSSLAMALENVPEETATARVIKVSKPETMEAAPARRFKWMGGKTPKTPDTAAVKADGGGKDRKFRPSTEMGTRDHHFQQHSTMRLGRCELCQDKMWGLQEVKCASCGVVCHSKCADRLPKSCPGRPENDDMPPPPSMFGRELTDQALGDGTPIPVIVTKCIGAVEANGMEYEGIYRKTGGSSQSKQITQLFERGRYDTFDLTNVESFNDISSITSVLKTYFRQLPDPLMTHALHESFVAAANIRDQANKHAALCALLKELPKHHYDTLKVLMLHLNRVTSKSSVNLMTSQNLGVVFGPTLLRSKDPGREFGDMAGKALSVQWMVDNAPTVFMDDSNRENSD